MALSRVLGALACALALVAGACSSDEGGDGGSGGVAATDCKPVDDSCYATSADGPGNDCLAKADYSASETTQLRVTQHQVAKPATLAKPYVQDTVITAKSALNQPDLCYQYGKAQFNLLMEIDTAQKMLTLGGGVPQALIGDPKLGTCWADFTDPTSSLVVKPVQTPYTAGADGGIEAKVADFVMPIYLEDETNVDSYVLVPLHQMTVTAKLSADKNCIGRYAHETLDYATSLCKPAQGAFAWENGGRYEGYITVEEADNVMVVSLGQTLCVVLTGDPAKWKGTENSCKTSTGFTSSGGLPKGDWCSTTNSADGCQDAWYLSIDIAAAAIKIGGAWDGSGCGL